ncbi:MAG: alanine--tRNA ligase-related protein, partial [Nanoarchaeota archaeon]
MVKTRHELIKAYLEFFASKKHKIIPNSPLVPEHDPTVLFTTAGMHPLVPYILGQRHPQGKRLVNVQKCIRTGDIESVGDEVHLTFFEMLGNWSLGEYWKKDAIKFSFEFLTKKLKLNPKRLHVTVFTGDKEIPRDLESEEVWLSVGIPRDRIYFVSREHNFWGPAGLTGPCGPCTEMFYDTGKLKCSKTCMPNCKNDCGKFFEIWNDVFMEYNKLGEGKYEMLKQKNVDTGMGVERTITTLQGKKIIYETELFLPIIKNIRELTKKHDERSERIIADHLKAACFILAERIVPSN